MRILDDNCGSAGGIPRAAHDPWPIPRSSDPRLWDPRRTTSSAAKEPRCAPDGANVFANFWVPFLGSCVTAFYNGNLPELL